MALEVWWMSAQADQKQEAQLEEAGFWVRRAQRSAQRPLGRARTV